jgi:UDP-3-O-[3-hydroxymyristoyl] N-acetylglucosamine deacetylase
MDGSSESFLELISEAGVVRQESPRRFLKILEKVEFEESGRLMSVGPSDICEIDCVIEFPHPLINRQSFHFVFENGSFGKQIASARTFGFEHEIEMLRKANLALGGSLDNAIVLTQESMLNEQPLRYEDEFVRHKILDIIGDLALLGMPIIGRVIAEKSGHSVHAQLMSKLLRSDSSWKIIDGAGPRGTPLA